MTASRRSHWFACRFLLMALLVTVFSWAGLFVGQDASANAEPSVHSAAAVPADSPDTTGRRITLPDVPAGFETTDAGWLHFAYPPSLAKWVEPLMLEGNSFKQTAAERLDQPVLERVYVRLAEDPAQMTQLAPRGAPYPKYAAGVAYSSLGLVLLTDEPLHPGDVHDLKTTFLHELAHVALHDALDGHRVPLWFNEGLAIHLSRENTFARMRTLWTASVAGNLIPLAELDRRFPSDIVGVPLAYAQSADIVRHLLRTADQQRFRLLIRRVRRGQAFESALYDSYAMDVYNLEQSWSQALSKRFSFWPSLFGGTMVWTFAVVLVTLAWRRKRTKQKATLERWAREEAAEDARAARLLAATKATAQWERGRPSSEVPAAVAGRDSFVPKIEHEGDWHTLH